MLTKIKNTRHQVATGVAMVIAGESFRTVFCDVTEVFCKDYSHEELNAYLDTDEPYDKAGAYAIQGIFGKYIDRFEGSDVYKRQEDGYELIGIQTPCMLTAIKELNEPRYMNMRCV